jgi:hypothetical protein
MIQGGGQFRHSTAGNASTRACGTASPWEFVTSRIRYRRRASIRSSTLFWKSSQSLVGNSASWSRWPRWNEASRAGCRLVGGLVGLRRLSVGRWPGGTTSAGGGSRPSPRADVRIPPTAGAVRREWRTTSRNRLRGSRGRSTVSGGGGQFVADRFVADRFVAQVVIAGKRASDRRVIGLPSGSA